MSNNKVKGNLPNAFKKLTAEEIEQFGYEGLEESVVWSLLGITEAKSIERLSKLDLFRIPYDRGRAKLVRELHKKALEKIREGDSMVLKELLKGLSSISKPKEDDNDKVIPVVIKNAEYLDAKGSQGHRGSRGKG